MSAQKQRVWVKRPAAAPSQKKAPQKPAAPKQAPKAAPMRKAKKPAPVQKVRNFMDPMCKTPAPVLVSDGKALPHTGLVSDDFTVGTVNTTVLLVTNTGSSGSVATMFEVAPDGSLIAATRQVLTIPTLAASDLENGPSASRAMKFSVSVVNCSNALKRGGRVTYLNSSQRLPARSAETVGQFSALIAGIKSSPYRRRINADDLKSPKHLIGYAIDQPKYATFSAHRGTLTYPEFLSHVIGASPTDPVPGDRPMSVCAWVFDPVEDVQSYSVTIRASYYTRWSLTSVPGQQMRHMPTTTAGHINVVHTHAEETANDLTHIVEGGLAATIGPRAFGLAKAGLQAAGGALRAGTLAAAEGAEVVGGAGALEAAALLL